ncbi:MAG: elongation factor 1-beta [Candidatus Nanoarchaeia archaeon]|nr:elongation factor 1-beta [Candidatus Nanoarchaeia archaeon]
MAIVYVTLKIMPANPEVDLSQLTEEAKLIISEHEGNVMESKEEPVAFGLKAVLITFSRNEDKGTSDDIEEALSGLENVASVSVEDVRRGIG